MIATTARKLIAALIAALVLAGATVAQTNNASYMPYMVVPRQVHAASTTMLAELATPFNCLQGVDPNARQDASGDWYISVFRIDSGDLDGAWLLRWRQGKTSFDVIGQLTSASASSDSGDVSTQAVPLASARGSLATTFDNRQLFYFAWQETSNNRKPLLRIFRINDYKGIVQ